MPKVLVTGASGFIGTHLVKALESRNWQVSAIRLTTDMAQLATRFRTAQLRDKDFVFHLAGSAYVPFSVEKPVEDFQLNLGSTIQLLEALRCSGSTAKVIFPSSGAVYGNPECLPITEEHRTEPISPYGVSKLGAEKYLSIYSRLYGIPAITLRLFSVYGPGQKKLVIFDLLNKMRANPNRIEVYGNGGQTRDFIHVEDVVEAMIIAALSDVEDGSAFNIASGKSTAIRDVIDLLAKTLSISPEVVYSGDVRPGDVENWSVDVRKAEERLEFGARVQLEEGLNSVYKWLNQILL